MSLVCRHCHSDLRESVIDLGIHPPSNAYLTERDLKIPETKYPLNAFICTKCWLLQLPEYTQADELFTANYAYYSSTSRSWRKHAQKYVEKTVRKLSLGKESFVIELASNDGYLLEYIKRHNIPYLGIEPTQKTAESAQAKGIKTLQEFFTSKLAVSLNKADLLIANNVLAHVPDINDFISGISTVLKKSGRASLEFPHLLKLIQGVQFDTIYHEHYSYLSLNFVKRLSESVGLQIVEVEKLKTHGGSLRVWLSHKDSANIDGSVQTILDEEINYGLESIEIYRDLQKQALNIKSELLEFLETSKKRGIKTIGYGAAAKGNTLLNFCGIDSDLIPYVADLSASKQGMYLPGSQIPIIEPEEIDNIKPDQLLVLPWNLINEIRQQIPQYKLITSIPSLTFWDKN